MEINFAKGYCSYTREIEQRNRELHNKYNLLTKHRGNIVNSYNKLMKNYNEVQEVFNLTKGYCLNIGEMALRSLYATLKIFENAKMKMDLELQDIEIEISKKPLFGNDGLSWLDMNQKNAKAVEREKEFKVGVGKVGAVLQLEKVVLDGKEALKLVGFENIKSPDQLPTEYTDGSNEYFFINSKSQTIFLRFFEDNFNDMLCSLILKQFQIGDIVSLKHLEIFKKCGKRLSEINKKLREVKPEPFVVKL